MDRGRTTIIGAVGAAALLAAASSANATLVSFASDDDSNFPTFNGTSGSGGTFLIRNGRVPASTPVTLRVDDNNGAVPTASVPVGMLVNLTASYVTSTPFGTEWNHVYAITGSYSFVHPVSGATLLSVQIAPGAASMNIIGSPSSWGSAGSITGSDVAAGSASGVDYTNAGLAAYMTSLGFDPNQYGLGFTTFVLEDFAFTMTSIAADGGSVALNVGHLPTTSWISEASHSGRAFEIPTPGAAAAAGVFGLMAGVRRRRKALPRR
ncbi:MAG: hypothetical protein IT438_12305 [Phycisphaerales bacterium]|nr:hypothetical protein [Phycisphaerales bacterium]